MPLPKTGRSWQDIKDDMLERAGGDAKWRDGKTAVYVFNAGPQLSEVQKEAYAMFMAENGLGPLAFPSLAQMEKDVVATGLSLLNAPEGGAGAITSGGTDSITMAMKTARDEARASGRVTGPGNIVLPRSAHLAFDKAAHLMDIEVRRVPIRDDDSYEADPDAMEAALDVNTIMMVGSAPNFPHGIIDPISELGDVAARHDVWLHVDACVGGYFAPFARMNGVDLPPFDFAVPAVKSMSADLHKYGYCAKGASTVLFRSEALYAHMPFVHDEWSGAPMTTPTLAGTRPGGAISAAWAVMQYLGEDGYRRLQGQVCATREMIETAIEPMGFEVLGTPKLGLLAFQHPDHHAFAIYKEIYARGWFTSVTKEPPSLHLMLSPKHAEVAESYLSDLADSLEAVATGSKVEAAPIRYS